MPTVASLKKRLAQTLKSRNLEAALGALTQLARKQPRDPSWPRRAAQIMHATSDFEGELAALRRALELQIEQGHVLDAIATCKSILERRPDDPRTVQTLDLLYMNGAPESAGEPLADDEITSDEPLESLLLTDLVPGAISVQVSDAEAGRINEIPIEDGERSHDEIPDLRLEHWKREESPEDLAAAQAVSLPRAIAQVPGSEPEPERRTASAPGSTPERAPARTPQRPAPGRDRGAALRKALAQTPIFGDLDDASLQTLIRGVHVLDLAAGQVLFRQGDAANCLYVIVEGAVVPVAEGERRRKLAVLERGEFFGEIGILTKQPRNATIEGLVDTKLLAIERKLLWKLISNQPAVAKSLLRFLRERMLDRQIRTNPLFGVFAHAERGSVARQFRILEVTDGTRVVEQARPADGLFVVLAGSLVRTDRERRKDVGEFGLGDVFGGGSLLEGETEPVDVVARGKCWLLVLAEARFRRIVEANPRLARVVRQLAEEGAARGSSAAGSGL